MKKPLLVLLTVTLLVSSIAFAGKLVTVPENLERSFKQNFPESSVINWEKESDTYIAEFKKNSSRHYAYFDAEGNLMGLLNFITTDQMPPKTMEKIKKKFGDIGKSNVIEVSLTKEEVFYFINIEHNGKTKTIKVYPGGSIEVFNKIL